MIDSILDSIIARFTAATDWIFDPLWKWYVIGLGILIVVMLVAYFLPFKWIRAGLGVVLLLVGAYIAGGRHMHQTMKEKLDEERAKTREREREGRQQGGGWFGRW